MKQIFCISCLSFMVILNSCENSNPPPVGNSVTGTTGYFHKDGSFYKTTDSAVNWALQAHCGLLDPDIKGISFISDDIGYFQSEGFFYKTTDSGLTWSQQGVGLADDIEGISFVN